MPAAATRTTTQTQPPAGAPGPRHAHAHTRARPAPPADLAGPGISPAGLVGKVLRRVQRSPAHPALTLYFADDSAYQVRVDGYDPAHPGLPKAIEVSPGFQALLEEREARSREGRGEEGKDGEDAGLGLTVIAARMTTLQDRGHEPQPGGGRAGSSWTQRHASIVLKFKEQENWHSISVMIAEYDHRGACTYRNFGDVYLDKLERRPHGAPHARRNANGNSNSNGTGNGNGSGSRGGAGSGPGRPRGRCQW